MKTIIISNRLPVSCKFKDSEWQMQKTSGGLVSALEGMRELGDYIWMGYAGIDSQIENKKELEEKLYEQHFCVPVYIEESIYRPYYNGFSNR